MTAAESGQQVSQADLLRIYHEMRLTTPFERLSPLQLKTLTVVARARLYRLTRRQAASPLAAAAIARPLPRLSPLPSTDLKRRAAGDFDESD